MNKEFFKGLDTTPSKDKGYWELDFIESALNNYWNDANKVLQRNDVGDMEKRNYEYQLNNSKELIQQIEKGSFYLQTQYESLLEENKRLLELERNFYMAICRAYNAGKQNQINIVLSKGSPDEDKMFLSSHDYFKTEFPEFTINVP